MINIDKYKYYDNPKLISIGYSYSTLCELIDKFHDYLLQTEYMYNQDMTCNEELKKILHKLEGSMQFLALSGPIEYINFIKDNMESITKPEINIQIKDLFHITFEVITKIKDQYLI